MERYRRYGRLFSLIVLDIDHFSRSTTSTATMSATRRSSRLRAFAARARASPT
jgi:hypothetical protein